MSRPIFRIRSEEAMPWKAIGGFLCLVRCSSPASLCCHKLHDHPDTGQLFCEMRRGETLWKMAMLSADDAGVHFIFLI